MKKNYVYVIKATMHKIEGRADAEFLGEQYWYHVNIFKELEERMDQWYVGIAKVYNVFI